MFVKVVIFVLKINHEYKLAKYGLLSHQGPASKPFEIMSLDTIIGFGGRYKNIYIS